MLRLKYLGEFRASFEGESQLKFETEKARTLLAYLALRSREPVRRDALAAIFWPDRPDSAAKANLRKAFYRLKKSLGPHADQLFEKTSPVVKLNSAEISTDIDQYRMLSDQVDRHSHETLYACETCIEALAEATELYEGELLSDLVSADSTALLEWLHIEREKLYQRQLHNLHILTEAYLKRKAYAEARRTATQQLALEPWRESAHGQLIVALASEGQVQAAFKQFDQCRAILDRELSIAPSAELRAILSDIHDRKFAPDLASEPDGIITKPPGNLAATNEPILGREAEIAKVQELLELPHTRLVTLFGAGGIGKSTLAQEVGRRLQSNYPDGVWFISFESNHAGDLHNTISDALDISLQTTTQQVKLLATVLKEERILLILDNFEDVIDDALAVADLIQGTQHLDVVCTSREMLDVAEEWVVPLQGLALPPVVGQGADEIALSSSVQLFVKHARRADAYFELTSANALAVAQICQFVDGSPLGVELAAAGIRRQTPSELLATMLESPDVLRTRRRDVPMRQRSMRTIFQYAIDGLEIHQRNTLARLSLFATRFSAEQAKQVANARRFDLADLVDKSLLRIVDDTYQMHPLMSQFSAELLPDDDESIAAFSAYFLRWAKGQHAALIGADGRAAAVIFSQAYENVMRAWQIAVEHLEVEALSGVLDVVANFWLLRGRLDDGIVVLQAAIDQLGDKPAASACVGQLRARLAGLLVFADRYTDARTMAESAVPLIAPERAGWMWLYQGIANWQTGRRNEAKGLYQSAIAAFEAEDNKHGLGRTMVFVGIGSMQFQQLELAHEQYLEALRFARQAGDALCETDALTRLAILTQRTGPLSDARYWIEKALTLCIRTNDLYSRSTVHNVMAEIAIEEENFVEAERFLKEAERLNRQINVPINSMFTHLYLGIVLRELGRFEDGETSLEAALRIAQHLGHRWWESRVLLSLAHLLAKSERRALAIQTAQRCMALALQVDNTLVHASASELLASLN